MLTEALNPVITSTGRVTRAPWAWNTAPCTGRTEDSFGRLEAYRRRSSEDCASPARPAPAPPGPRARQFT